MEEELLRLLDKYKLTGANGRSSKVIIQSFIPESLLNIHEMNPNLPLVQLLSQPTLGERAHEELELIKQYAIGVGPIVEAVMKQILMDGFFHSDPHPGNMTILDNQIIGLMDFGMVGRLTPDMKSHLASLIIGMMKQNTNAVIKAIMKMGIVPSRVLHMNINHNRIQSSSSFTLFWLFFY